ncbi:uncharacterized protein LOC129174410 [Dunckerocampus dactyliophorus]|uniref:uncharacterized protein LOC129174410 n=1 Tax=Dunckerocampus dactyliophorus TaxID=161453 RepID=UPI002405A9B2|nr:uncharacterized protein LOC129174410 [Dunckerocampus dactyliophorus]
MMNDGGIPNGRSTRFILIVFSLTIKSCIGFSLRNCRISSNRAICSASNLQAVPRDITPSVNEFDLSKNKISKIRFSDFRNYTALLELKLNCNIISQIEEGAFADLRSLQRMNLNNNQLTQLGDIFDGLSNLTELRINSNNIKTVLSSSFKPLRRLTFLDLSYNKLQKLLNVHHAIQHLPNLRYLLIRNINLRIFQSWELTNNTVGLQHLDLSQNSIDVFSVAADVFQNLTLLNISVPPRKQKMKWDLHEQTLLSRVSTLDIGGTHLEDITAFFESFNFSLNSVMIKTTKHDLKELLSISCTIPTLTQLQIRHNNLNLVDSDLLQLCSNVTNLDLASNRIQSISKDSFRALQALEVLRLNFNVLSFVPLAIRNLTSLQELDLRFNNIISLGCHNFAKLGKLRVLSLCHNFLTTIRQCIFQNLTNLQVLNMQKNQIRRLDYAFKRCFPNLIKLRLYGNQLSTIEDGEFESLRSLQYLALHGNHINKLEKGSFRGLTMLTDILLQSNDIREINQDVFNDLINLRRLHLLDNHIKYHSTAALPKPPFSRLSSLETLIMSGQHSRLKNYLPRNFLQGLTNLSVFDTRNVQLLSLHQDMFTYTPRLQKLDISSNDLGDVSPHLFDPIPNLRSLYISRTSLQSLDFLKEANLTKLEFLQARKNQYSVITEEQLDSLPALVYLDLQGNSFNYPPDLKGTKLLSLDLRSCSVDIEFLYFISTTCAILSFMLTTFIYHFLRWQLAYAYHLFLALLYERKHRNAQPRCLYDAFVSYNAHDEPWVFRELLPKLEGEQGWKLCLHHRDFQPGKPIIDNITEAIYASRKTICVISRRYLESEWCSREIQVASFRLFDEHKDVLILVFLEDIPVCELSPYYRMRKLLKKRSFLSWPRAAQCTDLFWEKLRQALTAKEDPGGEMLLLTVDDDDEWGRLDSLTMEDGGIPNGRSTRFILIVFSLTINSCIGFSLRNCRISYDSAICSASKLLAVPRDIPPSVREFDLSVNKISKIRVGDFRNYTALLELNLKRNIISQIEEGAFADLRSLQRMNLNNNQLTQLGDVFDGLSNLTELRINSNNIKTVLPSSFKPLRRLTFLDLSYNKLQKLLNVHHAIQHLPNLRYLIIKKIDLRIFQSWELTNNMVGLQYLDLSQNSIEVFSVAADVFQNLTWLNIGGPARKQKMKWNLHEQTLLSRVSTLDIGGIQLEDKRAFFESFNFSLTSVRMNAMKHNLKELLSISCTIPTLAQLQIRLNNLKLVDSGLLQLCSNVTELDLAQNRIQQISDDSFRALQGLKSLSLSRNNLPLVPPALRNLTLLLELDLSSNNITSLGCHDFAELGKLRVLRLYQNFITSVRQCVFKDLSNLQVLKMQTNQIKRLNDAFKKYLPNLRQLLLDRNKLTTIQDGEFEGLRSLQNLTLHENHINKLKKGSFRGLTMLTDILLQSNDIRESEITQDVFNDLINLRRLVLSDNHIKYNTNAALPKPPFSRLSSLETLIMSGQHSRGKNYLPRNFLQGLTNLSVFDTRNVQLLSLHQDMFTYTPRLQKLDISANELTDVSPHLFDPIPNLRSLYISRTSLQSLDFLKEANLTKLEFLQARKNQYSVITEEQLDSLPALVYLDLQGNSFTCDCDNAWFVQWVNDTKTQVYDAYNFVCNYPPDLKGTKLLSLDLRSCSVDIEFLYFISTTCAILSFMLTTFIYHFLRWQLAYAYHLFLALLYERKHRNAQPRCLYDAFVSYNAHDEPWVFRELLPKLEGEQGWKLCLHHRDFQPGKPIIDNITEAIYASRKTICVISRRYLESEWCSREIQVASFRLFDEHKDVLILVFLEDIPVCELSPYYRMRKLLKKRSFLSWPRAAQCTNLFWEKLRQALKAQEDLGGVMLLLTVDDRLRR